MKSKIELLMDLKNDIKNGTSYSVDYLLSSEIEETLSKKGIKVRKLFSPLLRLIYKTQTDYKLVKERSSGIKDKGKGKIFLSGTSG